MSPQSQISVSGQPASLTGNDLLIFEMSSALSSGRTERECVHQHILSSHFNQSSLRLKECPLSKASMPHVITFFLAWLIITSDFSRFWFFFFFFLSFEEKIVCFSVSHQVFSHEIHSNKSPRFCFFFIYFFFILRGENCLFQCFPSGFQPWNPFE